MIRPPPSRMVMTAAGVETSRSCGRSPARCAAARGPARQALLRHVRPARAAPLKHPCETASTSCSSAPTRAFPSIYSPSPIAGATAPITTAGHIALGLAESLFGLVMHQLRKPGGAVRLRHGPGVLDMATAQSCTTRPSTCTTYPRAARDGQVARPAELGLQPAHRLAAGRRPGRHGSRRDHPALHAGSAPT